jgi:hypothetical protein
MYWHRVDAVPDPGRVRIRIGIKMEIRIRISIKTMPIHNTVYTYTVCKGGRGVWSYRRGEGLRQINTCLKVP